MPSNSMQLAPHSHKFNTLMNTLQETKNAKSNNIKKMLALTHFLNSMLNLNLPMKSYKTLKTINIFPQVTSRICAWLFQYEILSI
jgi:hypothetical protein